MTSEQVWGDLVGGCWLVHRYNIQHITMPVKILSWSKYFSISPILKPRREALYKESLAAWTLKFSMPCFARDTQIPILDYKHWICTLQNAAWGSPTKDGLRSWRCIIFIKGLINIRFFTPARIWTCDQVIMGFIPIRYCFSLLCKQNIDQID